MTTETIIETATDFTNELIISLDNKLDLLATSWDIISDEQITLKNNTRELFLEVDEIVKSASENIKADNKLLSETSIYKISNDFIDKYILTVDETEVKKLNILELLHFINTNKLKIFMGNRLDKNNKIKSLSCPLTIIKALKKYNDYTNKTELKVARKLHFIPRVEDMTIEDKTGYLKALKKVVSNAKALHLEECRETIKGVDFLNMNIKELECLQIVVNSRITTVKTENKAKNKAKNKA